MRRRHGFTLTEMLVALALILLIMAIISEAFVAGLDSFRQMKAIGDLDQKMRAAVAILKRDLQADHFNDPPSKLSSLTPNTPGPAEGFFRIYQGSASTWEGNDGDLVGSYRAVNHALHFSVNLAANPSNDLEAKLRRRENFLSAYVPGTTLATTSPLADGINYLSPFGEVAYFSRPVAGETTPSGQQLYTLYRRQLVVLPATDAATMNAAGIPAGQLATTYGDVSCRVSGPNLYFNTMEDLTNPGNRALTSFPIFPERGEDPNLRGADILLTNVLSFDVRVLRGDGFTQFQDVGAVFPATCDTAAGVPYPIKALEITIRIWDRKTQTTRQMTIVQDM